MNLPELSKLVEIVADSIINSTNLAIDVKVTSAEVKLDVDDFKAAVAAVVFILSYSIRFSVSNTHLSNELQQIGFPAKHASTLCEVYNEKENRLSSALAEESLKCSNVKQSNCFIKDQKIIIALDVRDNVRNVEKQHSFLVSKDNLEILLHDLKEVYERMDSSTWQILC